jgi:hypothetical protein
MDTDPLALLANQTINLTFNDTVNKEYQKLQSFLNVTSYSMTNELHRCPRKYQLIKARAASGGAGSNNVDFAYGHSVGSGIQSWLSSGYDMDAAIFNGLMAWKLPYVAENPKTKKSVWEATVAIQKYAEFHQDVLDEWEVWVTPDGKPAIELSISVDFENGYKHYVHIDVILRNKRTGQLAVQENKTTSFRAADEALYANSNQALGYAAVVDMLSENTSFEVFYCVYSSTQREWQLFPFTKFTSLKAEWIADVRLDHALVSTYHQLKFFPKRGESCFAFNRRCEFFGTCNLTENLAELKSLPVGEEAERVDYTFKVSELIARQHERNANGNEPINQPACGITSID